MRFSVCVSATFLCTVTMVTSYRSGPPPKPNVCKEMFPGHGADSQSGNPPYIITPTMNFYQPNELMNVTISATAGYWFRGFFLQARRADCSHPDRQKGVGVFTSKTRKIKPMDCLGGIRNAVSHSSNERKNMVSVIWNAPAAPIGPIYFVATIVETKERFWTNLFSDPLRESTSKDKGEVCPNQREIPTTTTKDPNPERQTNGSHTIKCALSAMYIIMLVVLAILNNF